MATGNLRRLWYRARAEMPNVPVLASQVVSQLQAWKGDNSDSVPYSSGL